MHSNCLSFSKTVYNDCCRLTSLLGVSMSLSCARQLRSGSTGGGSGRRANNRSIRMSSGGNKGRNRCGKGCDGSRMCDHAFGWRAVRVASKRAPSVCLSVSECSGSSDMVSDAASHGAGPACALAEAPRCTVMPAVDWRRYHLSILFVDRTDTVRARIAAGFCERISEWNGFGRAILQSSCGLAVEEGSVPDPSTTAGLMAQAELLGIRPQLFRPARERFEVEDFYRYDVIVALDEGIRQELLAGVTAESGSDASWYADRVCCVSTFRHYCGDEILAGGGSAVLEREFSGVLRGAVLPAARAAPDIRRPSLQKVGPDEWNAMVVELLVACTGLFAFLRDQYPPDLPEYDPQ